MKRKLAVQAVVWILAASLLSGCRFTKETEGAVTETSAAAEKETITLGYLPITHALAMFEAKELLEADTDSQLEIELHKFSSWSDLMDALNSGQIDGASVLAELAMTSVVNGIDLKATALGHRDGNVIVTSEEIQTAEDAKGKTFAIPSNQSSHNILLQDMLTEAGLSAEDINVVQLAPSEMPSSLANGTIDGYCVAEPFGAQAVVQGYGHVLYHSGELWENSICCMMVFNGAYFEKNQDTVQRFTEVYQEAGDALDEEKAQEIAAEYLGQNAEILETSLKWIQFDALSITEEDYAVLAEKVQKYRILEQPPAYELFVENGEA